MYVVITYASLRLEEHQALFWHSTLPHEVQDRYRSCDHPENRIGCTVITTALTVLNTLCLLFVTHDSYYTLLTELVKPCDVFKINTLPNPL